MDFKHPDARDTDSKAGKNQRGQKLQISTGRRVYLQITALLVFSSDVSPKHQNCDILPIIRSNFI
jgi:hypothetical protein